MTLPREGMTQSHSRGNPTRPVSQLFAATDVEGKTFAPRAQSPRHLPPGNYRLANGHVPATSV